MFKKSLAVLALWIFSLWSLAFAQTDPSRETTVVPISTDSWAAGDTIQTEIVSLSLADATVDPDKLARVKVSFPHMRDVVRHRHNFVLRHLRKLVSLEPQENRVILKEFFRTANRNMNEAVKDFRNTPTASHADSFFDVFTEIQTQNETDLDFLIRNHDMNPELAAIFVKLGDIKWESMETAQDMKLSDVKYRPEHHSNLTNGVMTKVDSILDDLQKIVVLASILEKVDEIIAKDTPRFDRVGDHLSADIWARMDVLYALHDMLVENYNSLWGTEYHADSFFDVFTELNTTADSFFDVFVDLGDD